MAGEGMEQLLLTLTHNQPGAGLGKATLKIFLTAQRWEILLFQNEFGGCSEISHRRSHYITLEVLEKLSRHQAQQEEGSCGDRSRCGLILSPPHIQLLTLL